ncbi:hypothetical protein ACSSS7_004528 [Eimeria intestinalis]
MRLPPFSSSSSCPIGAPRPFSEGASEVRPPSLQGAHQGPPPWRGAPKKESPCSYDPKEGLSEEEEEEEEGGKGPWTHKRWGTSMPALRQRSIARTSWCSLWRCSCSSSLGWTYTLGLRCFKRQWGREKQETMYKR